MSEKKKISAAEFDRLFDEGSDEIDKYIDWDSGFHINQPKRVNVDMPPAMVMRLDIEAKQRGVSRQGLIKMWVADRLGIGVGANDKAA